MKFVEFWFEVQINFIRFNDVRVNFRRQLWCSSSVGMSEVNVVQSKLFSKPGLPLKAVHQAPCDISFYLTTVLNSTEN